MSDIDVMLRGGRVIDPESGMDGVHDVAVTGGQVIEIGHEIGAARVELDATGLVLAPGFIDLHSHMNSIAGHRLQVLDGVTTAFEMEAGATPVRAAYHLAAAEGRPVNYGFAASWALARMEAVAGVQLDGQLATFLTNIASPAWQRTASSAEVTTVLARLSADLADGALGIGILAGYAPGMGPDEYVHVAALAAEAGVPTFTHARDLIEMVPDAVIDGAEEIVRAAAETGAQMHYCHLNSTSNRHVDRVLDLVLRAQQAESRISTEAYPYGAGMTGIGAAFLAPERLPERGLSPSSLTFVRTGERIANAEQLRELRRADPGALVIIDMLDENDAADAQVLLRSLTFPGTIMASDAMPLTWSGPAPDPMTWPLPANAVTHPRSAGTFSRALRMLTGSLGPTEVLRRCSLLPARLLEDRAPAMRRKGRLAPGSDADIVVFDPATVSDRATYSDSTRPSAGIWHVLVNGTPVVLDRKLVADVLPGRAIRAEPR